MNDFCCHCLLENIKLMLPVSTLILVMIFYHETVNITIADDRLSCTAT